MHLISLVGFCCCFFLQGFLFLFFHLVHFNLFLIHCAWINGDASIIVFERFIDTMYDLSFFFFFFLLVFFCLFCFTFPLKTVSFIKTCFVLYGHIKIRIVFNLLCV